MDSFVITPCLWEDIKERASHYYCSNDILIDNYLEDYIYQSNYYIVKSKDIIIGYTAIYKEKIIVMFHIEEAYGKYSQMIFHQTKQLELVQKAMVPTSDEEFLSHCLDNFASIEKDAYFARYYDNIEIKSTTFLKIVPLSPTHHQNIIQLAEGFLDLKVEKIVSGNKQMHIYGVYLEENLIGFGNIEYSKITCFASIGMKVLEEYRQKGYGKGILYQLHQEVLAKGNYQGVSGCWYYNHNSKKSMESSGAYAKTRRLIFQF